MPGSGFKVACVDDDPHMRALLELALMAGGVDTHAYASGEEAVGSVADFAPDLILLDSMMPGLDGRETLRLLRMNPETRHFPVVFVTAKSDPKDIQQFIDEGAIGVIPKPIDLVALPDQARGMRRAWEEEVRRA